MKNQPSVCIILKINCSAEQLILYGVVAAGNGRHAARRQLQTRGRAGRMILTPPAAGNHPLADRPAPRFRTARFAPPRYAADEGGMPAVRAGKSGEM